MDPPSGDPVGWPASLEGARQLPEAATGSTAGGPRVGSSTKWDFVAVDSYQAGTVDAPNAAKYGGRAVPLLATWLKAQGHPDMPIGVGEYNGYTADSLAKGGQAILSTPQVWFGLVWNSEGGLGHVLTGDRLTAYQATKADPRALS
jgi:hypothetical protein